MSEPILAAVLLSILPGGVAFALQVTGLKDPAGFIVDPATGSYFISNENGQPTERDNNGFITKLDPDGKISKLKFIEGGAEGVTLNAPKGLALIGRCCNLTGVDFDAFCNMYVSDFSYGKVVRIDPAFRFQTIAEFLTTPASLGIDRKNHLILVPYRSGNVAEMNGLGRERTR